MNGPDVLLLVVAGFAGGIVTALAGGSVRATGDGARRNRGRSPDYSLMPALIRAPSRVGAGRRTVGSTGLLKS
jgi:hypothetical protein